MEAENNYWRIINTGFLPASDNMALDAVLLQGVSEGKSPNTFRFMFFSPACVLIGNNQNLSDEVNIDYCQENGILLNRRISGGGAILMDSNVIGWEIVANKETLKGISSIEKIYHMLCQGTIKCLQALGIDAKFRPSNDIEVGGKKISGTGGTDLGDAYLFHGTILVDFDMEAMIKALIIPAIKLNDKGVSVLQERLTWMSRELDKVPSRETILNQLIKCFEKELDFKGVKGSLNEWETEQFNRIHPDFCKTEWIYGKKRNPQRQIKEGIYKANGGLIKVHYGFDTKRNLMTDIVITGDFFPYPPRLVNDLETHLKNTSLKKKVLSERIESFFSVKDYTIPGVQPHDFVKAIQAALD